MKARVKVPVATLLQATLRGTLILALISPLWSGSAALAKEPSLTAIELYDGPSGAAYVQLTDVLINAKAEMRECASCANAPIDRSTYNKQDRLSLAAGGILERGSDGVMRYSVGGGTAVVVIPMNVKYDHNTPMTASDLADQAVLKGTVLGAPMTVAPPPIKRGVKLVFLAGPDLELAEFLRAQRANDIAGWKAYLAKYPTAPHAAEAKTSLATLFVGVGQAALDAYSKTAATPTPTYADLKAAKTQSDLAHAMAPGLPSLSALDAGIRAGLSGIVDKGRAELDAYRAALKAHTTGYTHLHNATAFSETVAGIDPYSPNGQALQGDILQDSNALQAALRQAESAVNAKLLDQALNLVLPYGSFAPEEPRIAAVIDGDYAFHMERGKQAQGAQDWERAIKEFDKAGSVKDLPEARDALKNAREQLVIVQDHAAAAKAQAASKGFEDAKDMIHAYETLSALPASQQKLVADDMERLKPAYVLACSQLAKGLQQAHHPIRGLADEIGMENAHTYLQLAYDLSENDSYHDRMSLLGDEISAYLLEQAKHYLGKPAGSGTEMGWTYLAEALPYKASNLDAVRDLQVSAASAHAIRSKLSIRVQFRDQTSQRDSAGFAGQLENAIITGLEGSEVPVKVVRSSEVTPVEPDFQLDGDVLQHHLTVVPVLEAMESKYLAGEKELPSEEWNKANREYEKVRNELQTAQAALQGAEAKGNKKEVEDLSNSVHEAEKRVQDAHVALDSTPRTITTDVIRPYTYSKKTVNIAVAIQLQFRIGDSFSGQRAELIPISKEDRKQYVVLENVKPEDTMGVKSAGTIIDPEEFQTTVENSALQALIEAVRKRVETLPGKIYNEARNRESGGDLDGAGESYMRYLEITPDKDTPERKHARQFLQDQFNMRQASSTAP